MSQLKINLLGPPKIFLNKVEIVFPLRKSAFLFFYLLLNKSVSRDAASTLLWPDNNESTAKKNLRNALYTIQKTLGMDIISKNSQSEIFLNNNIIYNLDINQLLDENNEYCNLYYGEFLQGINLSGLDDFEVWIMAKREEYKKLYIERQIKHAWKLLDNSKHQEALNCAEQLLRIDSFNEELYEMLIKINARMNRRTKCVEVYQQLKLMLKNEYNLVPSPNIKRFICNLSEIHDETKNTASTMNSKPMPVFFGRQENMRYMLEALQCFNKGIDCRSIAVLGEAGIGKTNLVRRLISTLTLPEIEILASSCYQAEKEFPLRPWSQIFIDCANLLEEEQISIPERWTDVISQLFPGFILKDCMTEQMEQMNLQGLYNQTVEEAMVSVLRKIAERKKLLIILEDIHWMDEVSLTLLYKLLNIDHNRSIFFIVTSRLEKKHFSRKYIAELSARDLIETMHLKRLNEKELVEFVSLALPEEMLTPQVSKQLYQETEGNLFFLVEYVKSLRNKSSIEKFTPGMRNVLESRILNISPDAHSLLNLLSISFDKVSLDDLRALSGLNDEQIADRLDELYNQGLVEELNDYDGCQLRFTHQKLREFVYEQMPFSRKRALHARYAEFLERKIKNCTSDNKLYSRLIYHFSEMSEMLPLLKYTLKNIGEYFHFNHEVFPVLGDMALRRDRFLYSNHKQALGQLLAVEELVRKLETQGEDTDEFIRLKLTFFHMFGRLYLRDGDYENGLKMIRVVIEEAIKIKDYNLAYDGYRQMFCFCMNTMDTSSMRIYIKEAFNIAGELGDAGKMAILKRLKGYLYLMEGKFDESEQYLRQAIIDFKSLEQHDRYVINIAASYYFLGENKRRRTHFDQALHYYMKGIELCEEKKWLKGLGAIYAAASQAAYKLGKKKLAEELVLQAISTYSQHDQIWGKSIAYSMYSLLLLENGKTKCSLENIVLAEQAANLLRNPYETGLVYMVKAEISNRLNNQQDTYEADDSYSNGTLEKYAMQALKHLQGLHGCYEVERIKMLMV